MCIFCSGMISWPRRGLYVFGDLKVSRCLSVPYIDNSGCDKRGCPDRNSLLKYDSYDIYQKTFSTF